MNKCIIEGCIEKAYASFCTLHWDALPPKMRQRWWQKTDYGRNQPNEQLRRDINECVMARGDTGR
jgi:hypothetical protein